MLPIWSDHSSLPLKSKTPQSFAWFYFMLKLLTFSLFMNLEIPVLALLHHLLMSWCRRILVSSGHCLKSSITNPAAPCQCWHAWTSPQGLVLWTPSHALPSLGCSEITQSQPHLPLPPSSRTCLHLLSLSIFPPMESCLHAPFSSFCGLSRPFSGRRRLTGILKHSFVILK